MVTCKVPPLQLLQPTLPLLSNYSNSGKALLKKKAPSGLLSQEIACQVSRLHRGEQTWGEYRVSPLEMHSARLQCHWLQCGEATAGVLRPITTVGGLGHTENNTGLTRGFVVYTLIGRSITVSVQSSGMLHQTLMMDLRIQCEQSYVKKTQRDAADTSTLLLWCSLSFTWQQQARTREAENFWKCVPQWNRLII